MVLRFSLGIPALLALIAVPAVAGPNPDGTASLASATPTKLTWVGIHAGAIGGFVIEPVTRTTTNTVSLGVSDSSYTANGSFVGGRAGYTFKTRMGLIGAEGDDAAAWASGTFNAVGGAAGVTSTTVNKTSMFGTARGIYEYSFGKAVLTIGGGVAWHAVTATRTQLVGQVNNATTNTVEVIPVHNAGATLSADVSAQLSGHLALTVGYLYAHFSHTSVTPLSLLSSASSTPLHAILVGLTYFAK